MEENNKMMQTTNSEALASQSQVAACFDEDSSKDLIIPRIKVINALSPERIEGIAQEGQLLNSLTQEDITGQVFVPIRQYYSCIHWNPERDSEPRIFCRSDDGRVGYNDLGAVSCATCAKCEFDNSKTGREAQPQCTKYLNFLGFISGTPMPIVLSFARTNYNEGRKMLSIAKSMRQALWNFGYRLESRKVSKDRNTWYIITASMAGVTNDDDKAMAAMLFQAYADAAVNADLGEDGGRNQAVPTVSAETESEL